MIWQQRYCAAHEQDFKHRYPTAYKDGHYFKPKLPDVTKANGLQKMICDFLKWSGHYGERINTMGIPVQKYAPKFNILSGQVEQVATGIEWRKSGSTTGSSDIHGHINNPNHKFPIPIKAEVKIGKDIHGKAQQQYEKKVTETGALYVLVKTPEDWFLFYDHVMSLT